jgi:hypothetical protein
MLALIVTNSFGDYAKGDQVTDPATIAAIRDSANAANVVAVNLPDPPATP